MDTPKETVSTSEKRQSEAIDSNSDNSKTTQGGGQGLVDSPAKHASSDVQENPSISSVKSVDSAALQTPEQQPTEIKDSALTEHESVLKDSASEKSSAGDTTALKLQSDFPKDAGTSKIKQDSHHGTNEMALSASSKPGKDAAPSKSTSDDNTTPDTTPKSVGCKLRKQNKSASVANQLDLDDTTESPRKTPASKEEKSSLAADVPQPVTPVAKTRGPKQLQLDEVSSMPEARAMKSPGPKPLATDKIKKTGVSTPALSSPKRTPDAAGMAASSPAKKTKYDTLEDGIESRRGSTDGMKTSGKKKGNVGSVNKPGRLEYNPPPAPHVVLHLSSGVTTRVARQFLKDHTKLLDVDPDASSINVRTIGQAEFDSWRKVVEIRAGLSKVPWRNYPKQAVWKLLIVDEEINGRWWKVFMEKDFDGLNNIVNEQNLLDERAVACIGDATNNMPSSQLFTWACNGLHIYQRQGRSCEWMKHRLENYTTESISAGAKRRIKKMFQDLENTYGGENQASAGLHPGHRIQGPPADFSREISSMLRHRGPSWRRTPTATIPSGADRRPSDDFRQAAMRHE